MLECGCPEHYPDWHNQDVNLGGQLVHTAPLPMFLHMPLGFEVRAAQQRHTIEQLGLRERWPGLVLTRSAAFRGQIMRLLENAVSPARRLEFLPEPFWVRGYLHEGGVGNLAAPIKHMQSALLAQGRRPKELYLCYLTCPRCSARRGGEKILLLRRWVESPALQKRLESSSHAKTQNRKEK